MGNEIGRTATSLYGEKKKNRGKGGKEGGTLATALEIELWASRWPESSMTTGEKLFLPTI